MKLIGWLFIGTFILLLFNNCKQNKLDVDVSDIAVQDVKIMRLDKAMFSITVQNEKQNSKEIENAYGSFYKRFVSNILNLTGNDSSNVLNFVSDKTMREVYDSTQKTFTESDFTKLETDLTNCLKRYRYFFPGRKYPEKFVAYMGGFNASVAYDTSSRTIGFGLEKFLGRNNTFYTLMQTPKYQTFTMSKEYIESELVRGWLITEFDDTLSINNLLGHMIFYGKIMYACDALLPDVQDSIKIGYSTEQMKYCKKAENSLWGFFAEKNHLYENDRKLIIEFTAEGPFTRAISRECPPRIAIWTGWQIVRSYMKNNEDVSLEKLMTEKDIVKILAKSKYRP